MTQWESGQAVISILAQALDSEDRQVEELAAVTLRQIGAAAVPTLVEVLESGQGWRMRGHVIEVLGQMGPGAHKAIPALLRALEEGSLVRVRAAEALGRMGPRAQEALPLLRQLLADRESWSARETAAWALRRIAPSAPRNRVQAGPGPTEISTQG